MSGLIRGLYGGTMRLTGMLMLAALGALAQVAHAEPQLSGAVLGQLEAVLEQCGRGNAANAEGYKSFAKDPAGHPTQKEAGQAGQRGQNPEAPPAGRGATRQAPEKEP